MRGLLAGLPWYAIRNSHFLIASAENLSTEKTEETEKILSILLLSVENKQKPIDSMRKTTINYAKNRPRCCPQCKER